MTDYYKYPSTPHLPWSPNRDRDDSVTHTEHFLGKRVVVTEKMDGENTTMYSDHIHARSIDSRHHPSRSWVKKRHAEIKHKIPEGWRVCGENLYAKHSIKYTDLPSYFMVFAIFDRANYCLSWRRTEKICEYIGLETVPVWYVGPWDEEYISTMRVGSETEGYVVRNAHHFHLHDFRQNVAKYVREGHVQTDEHWMHQEVEPNELEES